MIARIWFACLLSTAALATPIPAYACSLASGYSVPQTIDLVRRADTIVLARVTPAARANEFGLYHVRFIPFELLKGHQLPGALSYEQGVIAAGRVKAVPSDPRNIVDVHPEAFNGGCNRIVFARGSIVLLFLRRQGKGLFIDAAPFARTFEDVPTRDALWVKAVRLYVAITSLPLNKQRAEMQRRGYLLQFEVDDPDSRLLAQELGRADRLYLHRGYPPPGMALEPPG